MTPGLMLAIALLLPQEPPRQLDDFDQVDGWSTHPADGVEVAIRSDRGRTGQALRLDFDFKSGGGYAIVRRALPVDLPANYAFSLWLRGAAPANTLEFKLVDASGDNVWWYTERDRVFDRAWQKLTIRRRQISFAWGPRGGGDLGHMAALELVITAGRGGGKGSIWFDDLALTPLPELGPYRGTPIVTGSGGAPARLMDGDSTTVWRGVAAVDPVPLTIDFQRPREFGGLSLLWEPGGAAGDYDLLASDDAREWRSLRLVRGGDGGRDDLYLPDSEARYLRLLLRRPRAGQGYALRELIVQPLAYGASRNAFFQAVAGASPKGDYPRAFTGDRAWWTVVGVDEAKEEALFNEDGALDAGPGQFSVEPFLRDSGFFSWNDVERRVSLAEGSLPIPTVQWQTPGLILSITAFAVGPASGSSAILRYRLRNISVGVRRPTLYLAVRPFQVNPPWQFLGFAGGTARVDSVLWTGRTLRLNGERQVIPLTAPARVSATAFDAGEIVGHLRRNLLPLATRARDPFGAASAALVYRFTLKPGDSAEVNIEVPLVADGSQNLPFESTAARLARGGALVAAGSPGIAAQAEAEVRGTWEEALDDAAIVLPEAGQHLARTIRTTQAWIRLNRDGAAIQPGSRSYERSWIRDGALTSAALLRFGHAELVRDYLNWYASFQYANGKVPCCVDARGADPVPEHDSNGEFIYLVMEYWRHTRDWALLDSMWPRVERAVGYLDSLRQTRRTVEYQSGDRQVFFGLLPPSISHEGYSAKPMHSYWDDFFALRGLRDAAAMARLLGRSEPAARIGAMAGEFRGDLAQSLERAMRQHGIDYLPGAADLGDFDATSTTIAVSPGGNLDWLPRAALERTFERYWAGVEARDSAAASWEAYTPYELRAAGTMLRLGWKARALWLLQRMLADQEPPEWNQWPEVVFREAHAPKFIGDSPHTWVGSDFLRSAADLFVYEDEPDSALVIGRGIPEVWLTGPGVTVHRLSTWWGPLSYRIWRQADEVHLRIEEGLSPPPGGLIIHLPGDRPARSVLVGTTSLPIVEGRVLYRGALPAVIDFEY